jgi:hypothetical protein
MEGSPGYKHAWPAAAGLAPSQWFKRSPFKVSQGHSRLLKAIQPYSRVFGKKIIYFLCAIRLPYLSRAHGWTARIPHLLNLFKAF